MLPFVLKLDRCGSEGHTTHLELGNIRVELKFAKSLTEAITCLLYLEFLNSVLIKLARNITTDFKMDTVHILGTLRNVGSFLVPSASDLLPRSITKSCNVIFNADPHREVGSHRLFIHFCPKFSIVYFFDSYGIVAFVPDMLTFIRTNCTTLDHKKRQLRSLTSDVCGK